MLNELLYAWPIIIAFMLTGLLAGILAGMLGIGGGIIIVPAMYFALQAFDVSSGSAIDIAIATSLASLVPISLVSTRSHYRRGNIDGNIVKWWASFIVVTSIIGSLVITSRHAYLLVVLYGLVATYACLNYLLGSKKPVSFQQLPNKPLQGVMASFVGILSVLSGLGGGALAVPLLTHFNVPQHKAVGTASVLGILISFPAVVLIVMFGQEPIDAAFGNVGLINMPALMVMVPLTILFAPVGVHLGASLDQAKLKKAFAITLLIIGVLMIYRGILTQPV